MGRPQKKDAYDLEPRDLGRYRLHGEIASGGMATVHFGRQVGSGGFSKTVAIKRLHPQFGKMPEFVSMFLAEARLAARIRHPNVVQPLDVLTVDDELFLVMEYVEGDSLSRLMRATLARKERVPVSIAVSIVCGVLHGLHAAHEAKSDRGEPLELVHRDVSPQNVLVGVDGVSRVIDFGIAKAADSVQFTRDGELKGKLSYMAPEQLNGHRCTRRSDIYAASVILWEVLTSQRLFDADYQSAILKNILHRPVDPPSDVAADLPKVLDAIVLKGLARDPSDRFATARDMAIALEDSVPMATQSSVGSWVEVVAARSLGQRAARVAEIESVPSTAPVDIPVEEVGSEMFLSVRTPPPAAGSPASVRPLPSSGSRARAEGAPPTGGGPVDAGARASAPPPPVPSRRAPSSIPPPPDTPRGAPPVSRASRPSSGFDRADTSILAGPTTARSPLAATQGSSQAPGSGPRPPPPTISLAEGPAVAPQWPVPGIVPAAPGAPIVFEPAKRSSGGGILTLLFLIALGVVGFYFVIPELVKRGYASAAERAYGVTLSIDRVVVSFRQLRLLGVLATAREMPGVSVRCKEVDVTLSRFSPSDMVAYDVVANADGAYGALADAFARWSQAHTSSGLRETGGMQKLRVDSGQIAWTRPFGEGTRFSAENIAAEVERVDERALGDDYEVTAPIVDLTLASGKVGPWPVKVTTTKRNARAIVSFDSTGASAAQAVIKVWDGNLSSIDVTVPRTPFAQLGVEPAVVGLSKVPPFFLEGDAEYSSRSAGRVDGHVRLSATGVRLGGAAAPSQVDVELRLSGDPKAPIEWSEGVVAAGALRARPTGSVTMGAGFVQADLAAKAALARCPSGGDASLTTALHVDSRNLDGSSWTVAGGRCPRVP